MRDESSAFRRYGVIRNKADPAHPAVPHQAVIDYDPRDPRRKLRLLAEPADMRVGFPERVLHFVLRVFCIMQNRGCEPDAAVAGASDQFPKRPLITLLRQAD